MKGLLLSGLLLASLGSFAQNCEEVAGLCEKLLQENTEKQFVSDGQVYSAFLDREKAEFKTTFYGGTTYRVAASAGKRENYVIYTIKDPNGHVIFSNKNYKNAAYWDFKVAETLPVTIEVGLDPDLKISGCVVMLIGFQK